MSSEVKSKKKKKYKPFSYFWYDFVKITGAIPAYIWLRPKIHYPFGKPKIKGAVMVSANHSTLIDPIIIQLVFPWRRMNSLATKDLFNTPMKRLMFEQMHCIIVDKDNFSLSSFHEVVGRLEEGKMVVIFPEGQLNRKGEENMLAFKSGAVLMAHKAGAPIVPMYIVRNEKLHHRQQVVVGNTIDVPALAGKMPSMQMLNEISDMLRAKEVELREYYESLPIYKKLNPEK